MRAPGASLDAPARSFWKWVAAIVAIGFAVRVASVLLWYRNVPLALDDNYFYHWQARALADGRGFANPFWLRRQHLVVASAAHPPLYSLYLAAWTLIGFGGITDHRIAACVLGASISVPLALIGRRLGGPRVGLVAAVVGALYPALWINDGLLLSETMAAVTVAWAMAAALWTFDRPSVRRWAVLGGAVGLCALARSEAVALVVVLIVPLALLDAWRIRRSDSEATVDAPAGTTSVARRLVTSLVCAGLGFSLILGPWVVRNSLTFERFSPLSTGAGFVVQIANCDQTYSGELIGYWSPECSRGEWPNTTDESVIGDHLSADGTSYIRHHKKRAVAVAAVRVLRTFHLYNLRQGASFDQFFERRPAGPVWAGIASYFVLAAATALALARLVRRRRWETVVVLVAPIVVSVAATAAGIGITRYRITADVALAAGGALGLTMMPALVRRLRAAAQRANVGLAQPGRFAVAVAAFTAAAAAVRWFVIFVSWPTCAKAQPGNGRCFGVWGDAYYSSFQGVLNGRGHLYANPFAWLNWKVYQPSAGDPPFFSAYLGAVSWFGRSHVWWMTGLAVAVAVAVVAGVWWLTRRLSSPKVAAIAAVIAAGYLLFIRIGGGETPMVHRFASSCWGIAAVVFIALAARELGGPLIGLIAAGIAVVHPLVWLNDVMLMSESPYVAFVAFAVWAALRFWRTPTWGWALAMACGVGLAAVTRAEASTLFVLMVLPMILRAKGVSWSTRFRWLGTAAVIGAVLVMPWLTWNSLRFRDGNITTMTTGTGAVLGSATCDQTYYGDSIGYWARCWEEPVVVPGHAGDTVATAVGRGLLTDRFTTRVVGLCGVTVDDKPARNAAAPVAAGQTVKVIFPRIFPTEAKCPGASHALAPMDESETDGVVRGFATNYMAHHKQRLPAVAVLRVARMFSLYRPFQTWGWDWRIEGRGYWTSGIGMWMWWLMLPGAVAGLWLLWRRRLPVTPFVAIVVAIAVTAAGTFGINRYRIPADIVEIWLFAVCVGWMLGVLPGRAKAEAADDA